MHATRAWRTRAELARAMGQGQPGGPFGHQAKIIYDTDFAMPAALSGWPRYIGGFERVFDAPALRAHRHAFFRGHALSFLNIPGYLGRVSGRIPEPLRARMARFRAP